MLHVKLLGTPRIYLHDQSLSSQITGKELALLGYLIVTGRAHTRDTLAALLWHDIPDSQARKNLRDILPALREKIGPHLEISRQDIAFNRESRYWLDVEAFRMSLTSDAVQTDSQLLESAVDLYAGDFLEGFHVRNALAFEEWMENQRTHLNNLAIRGMYLLSSQFIKQKQYTQGLTISKRLLSIAPWHEESHRHYMMLLAKSGQRSSALAHFAICEQALLDELDVPPSAETVRLYEKIKAGEFDQEESEINDTAVDVVRIQSASLALPVSNGLPPKSNSLEFAAPVAVLHNLEMPLTPLIGRKNELAYLQQCLNNPACRLVTIWGMGGMGKTRLAVELAHQVVKQHSQTQPNFQAQVGNFRDGVYFVSLSNESQHNQTSTLSPIFAAISAALDDGVEEEARKRIDQKQKLFNYLKGKQILLVLDDFEHFAEYANTVSELLRQSPQLKVIVTSRQRLYVQGEWLLRLEGLSQIEGDDENWHDSGAVSLFLERAQQMLPNFAINPKNLIAVRRICQLVKGVPLGIELAAHWLYALDCETIADEIAQNPDFLTSKAQDIPERQRTLMTSLDYAWHLLTNSEKYALLQVIHAQASKEKRDEVKVVMDSVKHRNKQSTTTLESDAEPALISLPMISDFLNKSLLQLANKEMYKIHQLARQYSETHGKMPSM